MIIKCIKTIDTLEIFRLLNMEKYFPNADFEKYVTLRKNLLTTLIKKTPEINNIKLNQISIILFGMYKMKLCILFLLNKNKIVFF